MVNTYTYFLAGKTYLHCTQLSRTYRKFSLGYRDIRTCQSVCIVYLDGSCMHRYFKR